MYVEVDDVVVVLVVVDGADTNNNETDGVNNFGGRPPENTSNY